MMDKVEQEFLWSTRDGSNNEIKSNVYNDDHKYEDGHSLLILKADPFYPAIINITKQLSITGESCVLKSPVVVQVIRNLAQKADVKLNIEADRNDLDQLGINDKNKWTNDSQRLRVLELFYLKSQPRSEIARNLCIPYATICRIIRNWEQSSTSISSLFKFRKVRIQKWRRAQVKTLEFIKFQSGVFNSANIKHYIKTETGVDINQQSITSYLKRILGLSYKRISSRPSGSSISQTTLKRILFWLEFANLIRSEHVIVNIDETLFSRSTKINYSCTKRGIEWAVNNSAFVGSISLIAAIANKGDWFVSNLLSQNNSDNIILFIEKLMKWLQKDLYI